MTSKDEAVVEITTMEDIKRDLDKLRGTVDILRDQMNTIHVAFAARLDEFTKKLREQEFEIAQMREIGIKRDSRKDNDLDSVEYGTPGEGGRVEIYINTKEIAREGQGQIDAALEALEYLKKKMEGEE